MDRVLDAILNLYQRSDKLFLLVPLLLRVAVLEDQVVGNLVVLTHALGSLPLELLLVLFVLVDAAVGVEQNLAMGQIAAVFSSVAGGVFEPLADRDDPLLLNLRIQILLNKFLRSFVLKCVFVEEVEVSGLGLCTLQALGA